MRDEIAAVGHGLMVQEVGCGTPPGVVFCSLHPDSLRRS